MLSSPQLHRYSRHLLLNEVGEAGQERLLQSKVLVIGTGGLGSPVLLYLATAGVGTLGIVDHDTVALSNLQRQILFKTDQIGQPKTAAAAAAITPRNPDVRLQLIAEKFTVENAERLIADYDIVIDASDNFPTRFLISDTCLKLKKILVSAAISGFSGQLYVFKPYEPNQPCYRCLYPDSVLDCIDNCATNGILGSVAGVMGTLQATEVLKELLGIGESLAGAMLVFDALKSGFRRVKIPKEPMCSCSRE